MLTNGHILLEGVPGLGKTLALKTLAQALAVSFQRIQFTPDMLPADVVGTMIYNPRDGSFQTKHGPVFANLILADEINRAPAKVQSALLEAMQERQVTLGSETHALPEPFMVMATQNPVEQEGTYPLPEAQVDRFMLKVVLNYPTRSQERAILDAMGTTAPVRPWTRWWAAPKIMAARQVSITSTSMTRCATTSSTWCWRPATRVPSARIWAVTFSSAPRRVPRSAWAWVRGRTPFCNGRGYVTPQDVKDVALEVLRHRVVVSYEAEAEDITSDQIVSRILESLPVP